MRNIMQSAIVMTGLGIAVAGIMYFNRTRLMNDAEHVPVRTEYSDTCSHFPQETLKVYDVDGRMPYDVLVRTFDGADTIMVSRNIAERQEDAKEIARQNRLNGAISIVEPEYIATAAKLVKTRADFDFQRDMDKHNQAVEALRAQK